MSLTLQAHAKINIGLRITGRRDDGYHLIHTLFQEIDFGDEVTISTHSSGETSVEVSGPAAEGVPSDDRNLCSQAARLLKARLGIDQGVSIRIQKHIPMGAGLGGGSSDAAAVLKGLNELWQVGLTSDQLEEMAARLGADVPFFIRGGLQLGEGIGEVLTPLERVLPYAILLVIPPFAVDTTWAYGQFASQPSFPTPPAFDQLITRDPIPWEAFTNDFEEVVFPRYGRLAEIKAALLDQGAVYAGLSGSGSAVYGFFEQQPDTDSFAERFPDCQVLAVKSVLHGCQVHPEDKQKGIILQPTATP
ncbi:MAG: 4-(cytidine 5'-diphospho)-2-C-methyl-D-erythritol kinase [Candidatus Neomarinimicrobiota bacterium]